jgi:tRNA1Val (adenine37-N6)-methyltransferase
MLDIGTGTGLLALMAAQRNGEAHIDAVEMDEDACGQATENVQASPWADRIRVAWERIQDFTPGYRYNVIIANPPFYHDHPKRPRHNQNLALHSEALSLPELARAVHRLLDPAGQFIVLLPPYQGSRLEEHLAALGLFPVDHLHLYNHAGGKPIRRITTYAGVPADGCRERDLHIRDAEGAYTARFVQLLQPYYLYL